MADMVERDDLYEGEFVGGQGGPSSEMVEAAYTSTDEFTQAEAAGGQVGTPGEFVRAEQGQAPSTITQYVQTSQGPMLVGFSSSGQAQPQSVSRFPMPEGGTRLL